MAVNDYKVGQSLFIQWNDNRRSTATACITVVGRKWVTFEVYGRQYRFNPETTHVENSQADVWLSEQAYLDHVAKQRAWSALRKLLEDQRTPPDRMTTEQIQALTATIQAAGQRT